MTGICSRCGQCCMYVPWLLRKVPNAKKLRCPYLMGELGKTACIIYESDTRVGREIADHVFCGVRNPDDIIPGCTYFYPEPKINESISRIKTI